MTEWPAVLDALKAGAARLSFSASCEPGMGRRLAALAASRPGGRLLELGTGAGLGTAALPGGMDRTAHLDTLELDPQLSSVSQSLLGPDGRATFHVADGDGWLVEAARANPQGRYDLIFADTWPGKFWRLDEALTLLRPGGLYVIGDLHPQANWPAGHQRAVDTLRARLEGHPQLACPFPPCLSGLMLCVRRPSPDGW